MSKSHSNPHVHAEEFLIINKLGLHTRAAAKFVKLASQFNSDISVCFKGESVDGKSILDLLALGAAKGSKILVTIQGDDSFEAFKALRELVATGFGED